MHVSITDGEVLDLVSAWPGIEHLYLDTAWDWGVAHLKVTFYGLAGILERCPNPRSIGVNLDTSALHDSPLCVIHRCNGTTREKVTNLNVGSAECDDVEAIGNLLAGMCPNLIRISRASFNVDSDNPSIHDEWSEEGERWKEVEAFIAQKRGEQLEQNNELYTSSV